MKKLLFVALAVVFAAGFIAEAAIADERLSLSGSMRVRGWIKDGFDFDANVDDEEKFWDQRFRLGATIQAAEGVSGHLRFDFAEDFWGSDNWNGFRFGESSELQVDRAYLQIDKEMFTFRAGQQYLGLGNSIVYDNNGTGLLLQLKLPVTVTLGFTKESESGSKQDEAATNTEDVDHYFAQVHWASDMYSLGAYYAQQMDDTTAAVEPHAFGVFANANLGMFNVIFEGTIFGGDRADTGEDFVGTQFWAEISANLTEQFKIGVDLIYALGTDDLNESQITDLTDFGSFTPEDRGPFYTEIASLGGNVFDVGLGDHQGSIGAGLFADFAVMEGLLLQGQVLYLTAEEDSAAFQVVDDWTIFNIGAQYEIAPKATVSAQYHYASPEVDGGGEEEATALVWKFQIKF